MSSTPESVPRTTVYEEPDPAAQHAEVAKEKAAEATSAAGESAKEASKATGIKLSQAGTAIEETAVSAKQTTQEALDRGMETASDYTKAAGEKASHVAAEAKEKLTEAGEVVQSGVHSALEYIKEHLPTVVHQEETPAERESRALLDEAMGRPVDTPPLTAPEVPADLPSKMAELGLEGEEPTPGVVKTVQEASVARDAAREKDQSPISPPPPTTTSPLSEAMTSRKTAEEAVVDANRRKAASLVERANKRVEGWAHTADSAMSAPFERKERKEGEERSAKTPMQALGDKVESATEYVSTGRGREGREEHHAQPHVHEVSALPGDIHVPLITRAFREKVLHRHPEAPVVHPGEYTGTVQHTAPKTTATPPETSSAAERFKAAADDAARHAAEATRTVEDKAFGAAHTVGDTLSSAYHKIADPVAGALHTAEEKASWAAQHTRDELFHKSAEETRREMAPHSLAEAKMAAGEVPYSTAELLKSGTGAPPAPVTPNAYASAEDALAKSAEGYGEENLAPSDARDVARAAVEKEADFGTTTTTLGGHSEDWAHKHPHLSKFSPDVVKESLKEGVHDLDVVEPGSEGELPS